MVDFASLLGVGAQSRQQIFRNFSVYTQGAKWGNAAKATVDMSMEGGDSYFERGEFIGSSWGPIKSSLSLESFVPILGKKYQQDIVRALSIGNYVFVTVGEIGSQILQLGNMVVKSVKFETDMAKGGLSMSVNFEGGSPGILQSTKALPLRLGGF